MVRREKSSSARRKKEREREASLIRLIGSERFVGSLTWRDFYFSFVSLAFIVLLNDLLVSRFPSSVLSASSTPGVAVTWTRALRIIQSLEHRYLPRMLLMLATHRSLWFASKYLANLKFKVNCCVIASERGATFFFLEDEHVLTTRHKGFDKLMVTGEWRKKLTQFNGMLRKTERLRVTHDNLYPVRPRHCAITPC